MQRHKKKHNKQTSTNGNQRCLYTFITKSFAIALLIVAYKLISQTDDQDQAHTNHLDTTPKTLDTAQQLLAVFESKNIETTLVELEQQQDTINVTALSPYEMKLQELRKKSPFNTWLKQLYPVKVDPRIIDTVTNIETARKKCVQAFIEILEETSFFPNLLSKPNLRIVLIPPDIGYSQHSYGVYSFTENMIGIVYSPDITANEYKRALKNEFFSHQVAERNILNGVAQDKSQIILPFLRKNSNIDEKAFEKFVTTLIKAKEELKQYKNLLARKPTGSQEEKKINDFLLIVKNYSPKTYYLSEEEFNTAVKLGVSTEPDSHGYFTSGIHHPQDLPLSYGYQQGSKIFYTHGKDETPRSKAIALLSDVQMQLSALEDKAGPYFKKVKAQKLTELASFIAELPTTIQKFLFPDFYDYMCEFFATDKNSHTHKKYFSESITRENEGMFLSKDKKPSNFFQPSPQTGSVKQPSKQKHTTTQCPPSEKHYRHGAR
jgi:hypothetical protein